MEWASEILMATAKQACGWEGVILLAAAVIATYLFLLHRQLLAEGNEILLSTALVMVAAFASSMHWLARPHLVTHLFGLLFAIQLRNFDRNKLSRGRLLGTTLPLMVLWVNLHGGFFVAFLLIAAYLTGHVVAWFFSRTPERDLHNPKIATLILLCSACFAASLANPNGIKLHVYIVNCFRIYRQSGFTNEFLSPNFHSSAMQGFLLQLLLFAILLLAVRPSLRVTDVLLVGGFGCLALQSARNVPLFALITAPVLAEHFTNAMGRWHESRFLQGFRQVSMKLTIINRQAGGRVVVAILVLVLVLVIIKPRLLGGKAVPAAEPLTNRFPNAATTFLVSHPDAVCGEMFNDYGWGGYLMLAMPQRKVFIDGRNDFYGPDLVREFDRVTQVHPGWSGVLQKYNVGWTILPRTHALNRVMAMSSDWHLVYTDDVTTIYGQVNGP